MGYQEIMPVVKKCQKWGTAIEILSERTGIPLNCLEEILSSKRRANPDQLLELYRFFEIVNPDRIAKHKDFVRNNRRPPRKLLDTLNWFRVNDSDFAYNWTRKNGKPWDAIKKLINWDILIVTGKGVRTKYTWNPTISKRVSANKTIMYAKSIKRAAPKVLDEGKKEVETTRPTATTLDVTLNGPRLPIINTDDDFFPWVDLKGTHMEKVARDGEAIALTRDAALIGFFYREDEPGDMPKHDEKKNVMINKCKMYFV